MEAYVEAYLNEKITHNGLTETSYMVTMDDERIPLKMQFPRSVRLNVGETYQLKSKPTTVGLSGLSLFVYGQYRSVICTRHATWQTLKKPVKMEEPKQAKLLEAPISLDNLQNYFLKNYFKVKSKSLTKGITEQHAHEIALKAMDLVPKHFFGQRDLPA